MMRRTRRFRNSGFALLILSLVGCSSPFEDNAIQEKWKGYQKFTSPSVSVAAADEEAAEDAHDFWLELVDSVRQNLGAPPPKPLIVSVSIDDDPLLESAEFTADSIAHWHASWMDRGEDRHPGHHRSDLPEELREKFLKLIGGAIPLRDQELGIPHSWFEDERWAFVYPTDQCVRTVVDLMFDYGMEQGDFSMSKRIMISVFLPIIKGKVIDAMKQMSRYFILEGAIKALGVDASLRDDAIRKCAEDLGLENPESPPEFPGI